MKFTDYIVAVLFLGIGLILSPVACRQKEVLDIVGCPDPCEVECKE